MAQESGLAGMARGYAYAQGHAAESKPIDESWASSAGGIVSTAGDLQKWGEALASGRIISPSDYQLLTSPAPLADGSASDYGFGMKSIASRVNRGSGTTATPTALTQAISSFRAKVCASSS
jgi:CubicO group peptidase (beta-lactamase class C family)